MGKTKFIVIPCLVLSLVFGILSIPKTLSLFTDRTEYSFVIYPYDGRNDRKCTFDDGSTIKGYRNNDVAIIDYSFTNPTVATVKTVDIVVTLPNGMTHSTQLTNIAPGTTNSATFGLAITEDMLTPLSEQEGANKYRTITVSAVITKMLDAYGNDVTINHSLGASTLCIYKEGGTI